MNLTFATAGRVLSQLRGDHRQVTGRFLDPNATGSVDEQVAVAQRDTQTSLDDRGEHRHPCMLHPQRGAARAARIGGCHQRLNLDQ